MIMQKENADTATPPTKRRWAELQMRAISAIVLGVPALAAVTYDGFWFNGMIVLLALVMHEEWHRLVDDTNWVWRIGGWIYVLAPALSLMWLRDIFLPVPGGDPGMWCVLYVMLSVWATDIGAYFAGRAFGGPKLWPALSPSKTWAGLAGGVVASVVAGILMLWKLPYPATMLGVITVSACLAVVAQAGDFFESWLKRRAGVKDSGTIIPGHGGLLDRVDGLVFAAPFYALLVLLFANTAGTL
jgi:phosphatidate cytidylyltransferase